MPPEEQSAPPIPPVRTFALLSVLAHSTPQQPQPLQDTRVPSSGPQTQPESSWPPAPASHKPVRDRPPGTNIWTPKYLPTLFADRPSASPSGAALSKGVAFAASRGRGVLGVSGTAICGVVSADGALASCGRRDSTDIRGRRWEGRGLGVWGQYKGRRVEGVIIF